MRWELRRWQTLALMAMTCLLGSCASTEKIAWVELKSEQMAAARMIQITGTVVRSDLEGGFYLIRNAQGTNFNPTNLPKAFQVDGLAIEAAAQRRDGVVSIGMVGTMVDLVRIRARTDNLVFVSGTVAHRERLALPPDAVIEVQLLDVSRQDAPAMIIAANSFSTQNRQAPIPFVLGYDPEKIQQSHIYAVRAEIRSQGALVFTTSSRYPVITAGHPTRADLMLVRVEQTTARQKSLSGTAWILEDLSGAGVVDRVQATLVFSDAGTVSGNASCNQFRGTVTASADVFTLDPLATTRRMCPEAIMHQEARYLEALRGAERFEVKGDVLYFHIAGKSQPLRLIAATNPVRQISSSDMTGIWTVVGHHIPGISAMNDADAKAWHGRTVRLTASQAISPESHCDEPAYNTVSVTKESFLSSEFNLRPGSLMPLESLERIAVLQVSCGRERWATLGGRLIRIDRDRVLAFWDGVFFELARDRDFRAVGQEPFWRLEIEKGKEMRFMALGQRQASTPAPVPGIDPANGASFYHAVTEANDLRVVIELTRCTDVMSGKQFENTVTVTLNRQTYRGCGESAAAA